MSSPGDSSYHPMDDSELVPDGWRPQHRDHDAEENESIVLSPANGYHRLPSSSYRATSDTNWESNSAYSHGVNSVMLSASPSHPSSSNTPYIPDVWVTDPSLAQGSTVDDKAREARLDEEQAEAAYNERRHGLSSLGMAPSGASFSGQANASRTLIASPHHSRTSSAASTSAYTPSAARSYQTYSEDSSRPNDSTPLFISTHYDAPPAYTPSSTSPTNFSGRSPPQSPAQTSQQTVNRSYQTFPSSIEMRGNQERQQLLPHDPESMGGQPGGNEPYVPEALWRRRYQRGCCGISWLKLVFLVLLAGFVVLITLGRRIVSGDSPHDPTGKPSTPHSPIGGGHGGDMGYPAFDGHLELPKDHSCSAHGISSGITSFSVNFSDDRSLIFEQVMERDIDSQSVHFAGDVVVRRSGAGTPGPSITVETIATDASIKAGLDWDETTQAMRLTLPGTLSSNWGSSSCMTVRVTVWVPDGSSLPTLAIKTVQLGIVLADNLALQVGEDVTLRSISGAIVAATNGQISNEEMRKFGSPDSFVFDSRHISVETTSASIAGSWPLYDSLSLKSTSGSVNAAVEPKEVSKDHPEPALLSVTTTSGSITVSESVSATSDYYSNETARLAEGPRPSKLLPIRDYGVDIHTTSGSIKATVAFTQYCKIRSSSSSHSLELLPVLGSKYAAEETAETSELVTTSTSGTITCQVLEPIWSSMASRDGLPKRPVDTVPSLPPVLPEKPYIPIGDEDPYKLIRPIETTQSTSNSESETVDNTRPLLHLASKHQTTSGSMNLVYPASWEGTMNVRTTSGSLSASGNGVQVIEASRGHLRAKKGASGSGSVIDASSTGGSIHVRVGF